MKLLFLFISLFPGFLFSLDLSIYFKSKTEREVYVIKQEFAINKLAIPFHYNEARTSFELEKLLRIPSKRIRSITYTYADNQSEHKQEQLNKKYPHSQSYVENSIY